MDVDSICLQEAKALAKRSPKYWYHLSKLYLESLGQPEYAKTFRAAYFFCRHIDDVLDGDRQFTGDPGSYVREILSAIEEGRSGPPIVGLYDFAIGPIQKWAAEGENPKQSFLQVIKAMLFDFERSKTRAVFTGDELERYYDETFIPVMDISFIISGTPLRSADIPEIISTQGHIYTIMDMATDLERGIINIPKEVIESSGADAAKLDYAAVKANPTLSRWCDEEVRAYQAELGAAKAKAADFGAKRICAPLILRMEAFCLSYRLGLRN